MKKAALFLAILLALCPLAALGQDENIQLKFTFTGDCTLGCNYSWMNAAISFVKVVEEKGYDYPFANVKEIFENDDLTVINLENVLQDSNAGRASGRKWNFRGPTDYVNMITQNSIEACSLGNNHMKDFGSRGVKSTKEALTGANIGWFIDKELFFFEKDGVKVAFLSFWESSFNSHKKWLKTELPRLKNEEDVDFIVLCLHAGTEYRFKHTKATEEKAHLAIDYGADLVVGTHPHVLEGLEVYKDRTILYSLGNFVFGGNRTFREGRIQGMLAQVTLTFDPSGEYQSQQTTLIPCQITGTMPKNNYQPFLLSGEEAQAVIDLVQQDTDFPLPAYQEGVGSVIEPIINTAD